MVVLSNGCTCSQLVTTKNPTNLKSHLQSHHKEAYAELTEKEMEEQQVKASKRAKHQATCVEPTRTLTLHGCLSNVRNVVRKNKEWDKHSSQYNDRVNAVRDMIISTGYPVTFVDQPTVRNMLKILDPKLRIPGSAKMQKLLIQRWKTGTQQMKSVLGNARTVTICLDGWSKKNLTASFLGISACFYDPVATKIRHVVLELSQMEHPHAGEMLAEHLEQCMQKWSLSSSSTLMIVSHNGSNMVKAVHMLNERQRLKEDGNEEFGFEGEGSEVACDDQDSEHELSDTEVESEDEISEESATHSDSDYELIELADLHNIVPYQRLMCIAHTLQLVIRKAYVHYDNLLIKVRRMLGKIKKSSVAVARLKNTTGKVLLSDNNTRWNSTYRMIQRLIEVKDNVNAILADLEADTLLVSERARLAELCQLLQPFAEQTDKLQSNSKSPSYVIPVVLELECHLHSCSAPKAVTNAMLDDIRERFRCIRDPSGPDFTALPAASCLLDPLVASVLMTGDMRSLLEASKDFVITEEVKHQPYLELGTSGHSHHAASSSSTAMKDFPLLAAKLSDQVHSQSTAATARSIQMQIDTYMNDIISTPFDGTAIKFWRERANRPTDTPFSH